MTKFKVLAVTTLLLLTAACAVQPSPTARPQIPIIEATLKEGKTTLAEVRRIFGDSPDSFSSSGDGSMSVTYSLYGKYPLKIIKVTYVMKNGEAMIVPMAWGKYYGQFKVKISIDFNASKVMKKARFYDMY